LMKIIKAKKFKNNGRGFEVRGVVLGGYRR
jgi:hypothetical protein